MLQDCPGEWEQGCDLGNNEKYVGVSDLSISNKELARRAREYFSSVSDEDFLKALIDSGFPRNIH